MTTPSSDPAELPAIGFLAELSSDDRAFLAIYGKYLRPSDGETLITEGEAQDSLYVILSGKLHIVTSAALDRPMLLAALEAGDSMGEINLFDPGAASASAVVRSAGIVWVLSRENLDSCMDADPVAGTRILRALLGQLARRIRAMNEKLATAEKKSSLHEFWATKQP
jgi:CRP-like cAMP-binding protein